MIYLINISSYPNFKYWVVDDTTGASLSAPTPQDAITEFERSAFDLTYGDNNYYITDKYVLCHNKHHGDILAKAPTIQQLIDNYPEYFI